MITHTNKQRLILALCSLLGGMESSIALAAAPSQLKSPYFIDAIHCEGLDELIDADQLKSNFADDEVATVGMRVLRQKQCDAVFKAYDVEPFTWVTPQDLETLEFALKRSQRFASVDISIAKSELPNHVHLTGKFKLFAKSNHYTVHSRVGTYRGTDGSGDRHTTDVDARIDFGRRGPHNDAPFVVAFGTSQSRASQPLPASALTSRGKPMTLSAEEAAALNRPTSSYGHLDLRFNLPSYATFDPFIQVGIDSSRLSGDAHAAGGSRLEAGVVIHDLYPWGFRGRTQVSYLMSRSNFSGTDTVSDDPNTPEARDRHFGFIGLSSLSSNRDIDEDFAVYRSLTKDLHAFGHLKLLWRVAETAGFKHGLGLGYQAVLGAVLPQHRFGLPSHDETEFYYDLKKPVVMWGGDHEFNVKLGYAAYSSQANSDRPYYRATPYGELGWKVQTGDFDVGLAMIYGGVRLY